MAFQKEGIGNCAGTTGQKQDQNSAEQIQDKQLHIWHLKLMMVSSGHQWTQEALLL